MKRVKEKRTEGEKKHEGKLVEEERKGWEKRDEGKKGSRVMGTS